ncbi:reverse transcriptase domain-containing protein [Tanacetum coccineum]|uniref:Reverse transcriptase domain-containing protein n=1 Tax=Tanacetum coccineum TaxID=301880 RepID=A0ABQ4WXQ4_9ASTR
MSTHEQITNNPTSAVRNTGGRNGPQGMEEPMSDEVLREMCDKNYHQLLPLIAEKMQKEKEQKDRLNAVKARLIYGEESGVKIRNHEESHYSESKTPTARTEPRRRHGGRYSRSPSPHASVFKRLKKNRSPSPQPRPRKEGGVFKRLGRREPVTSARSDSRRRSPQAQRTEVETRRRQQRQTPSHATSQYSESEDSEGGHWKSKSRRQKSNTYEDDLYQPWTCEERNPFTLRIRHFSLPRTRMPSHVKTYDGSGDPEDHLKLFQSAAKTEGWAMPTWCHMFNSTLTGNARVWFDKLPKESIDSYEDLRTAFRENYLQQTKHIKDPVEIHHIKQRDGESTEDFMERYKAEVLDVEDTLSVTNIVCFIYSRSLIISRSLEDLMETAGTYTAGFTCFPDAQSNGFMECKGTAFQMHSQAVLMSQSFSTVCLRTPLFSTMKILVSLILQVLTAIEDQPNTFGQALRQALWPLHETCAYRLPQVELSQPMVVQIQMCESDSDSDSEHLNKQTAPNRKILITEMVWQIFNMNVVLRMVAGKGVMELLHPEEENEMNRCREVMREFFSFYFGNFYWADALPFPKMMKHRNKIREILQSGGRKTYMELYLISACKKTADCQNYDAILLSSLRAGSTDTTTVMLTWTLCLLLNNPRALMNAQEELDNIVGRDRKVNESDITNLVYLQAIVKETLRLYPAGRLGGTREFSEDCIIAGYHVPKGTWLITNLYKLQQDPKLWPNSQSFRLREGYLMGDQSMLTLRGHILSWMPLVLGGVLVLGIALGLQYYIWL